MDHPATGGSSILLKGWITPLIDLLFAGAYILLLPALTRLFTSESMLNGWLVLGGYFILCASTWQLLKLEPAGGSRPSSSGDKDIVTGCTGFLSLCFGIVVVVMVLELSGVLNSGGALDKLDPESFAGPLFGIGMFFVSLAYMFIVLIRPKPNVKAGTALHALRHVLGVAGVNFMFVVTLAFWDSYMAGTEADGVSIGLHILLFLVFYVIMVMFLAPPRIILNLIDGSRWGLASFLFWLAVYCWNMSAQA